MDIRDDVTKTAKDAAYVVVGLGVMGYQRAQVRRRELVEIAKHQLPSIEAPIADAKGEIERRVKDIDGRFEALVARLESQLHPVEEKLPASAQAVLGQAREVRSQVRQYILSALAA